MSADALLPLTPLQSLLGFDYLPPRFNGAVELLFAFVCFGAAIALRRRRWIFTSPSFLMLGFGRADRSDRWFGRFQSEDRRGLWRRRGAVVLLGRSPPPDGRGRLCVAPRARYFEHPARPDQLDSLCGGAGGRAGGRLPGQCLLPGRVSRRSRRGDRIRGPADLGRYFQRPRAATAASVRAWRLGAQRAISRPRAKCRRAFHHHDYAWQRTPRDSQLRHRQGGADQLRRSSGQRRNLHRHQLQRAAQPGARSHSQGDGGCAARADGSLAGGAGLGVRRLGD